MHRNRYLYFILLIVTVFAGLSSRHFSQLLPEWVKLYLGDALWALMVFWILGFIFIKKGTLWIAMIAILFSFGIEISQLYHAEWIDVLRSNRIGGLILGYGFLWSDLICYTLGISAGVGMELIFLKKIK